LTSPREISRGGVAADRNSKDSIGIRGFVVSEVRSIWQFRELLRGLVVRNLKLKYQRSLLGFLWTLANPILTVVVLTMVFSVIVRLEIPNYWAFLVSGYFVWHFASQGINTGTYVFFEHADLIRTVAFPSEILVFSSVLSRFVEFLVAIAVVGIVLAAQLHHTVPASFVLLPWLFLLILLTVLGLTFPVAAASAFYYDIKHALPVALMTLFYLSPVFYPSRIVPEPFRVVYFLNPLAGLLTLCQTVLYDGAWPSIGLLTVATAYSVLVFVLGFVVFNKYEALYPEIV